MRRNQAVDGHSKRCECVPAGMVAACWDTVALTRLALIVFAQLRIVTGRYSFFCATKRRAWTLPCGTAVKLNARVRRNACPGQRGNSAKLCVEGATDHAILCRLLHSCQATHRSIAGLPSRAEAASDPGPWRQPAILGRGRWDMDGCATSCVSMSSRTSRHTTRS